MKTKLKSTVVVTIIVALTLISIVVLRPLLFNDDAVTTNSYASHEDIVIYSPKSYLIEDVPYIGQETSFFCAYASLTMIFQYFKMDTTLNEILYFSGVGYSLIYQDPYPTIIGGFALSQLPADSRFIANLYGLSFDIWYPDDSVISEDMCWQEYWQKIKQNISKNTPIQTSVDPFILPSIKRQFDVSENIWDYFGSGGHSIVIVGYNESNETVCYNDPGAEYFGDADFGMYAWMSLDELKEAVMKTIGAKYLIQSFKKISDPLPHEEAFELAHERNIERLKGNLTAYDKELNKIEGYEFGISASQSFKDHFKKGLKNRFKTIVTYKMDGMQFKRNNRLIFINALRLKIPISFIKSLNPDIRQYDLIAMEKQYTAKYLRDVDNSLNCNYKASLFDQEAEYWFKLSEYYDKFLKRGFLILLPHSIFLMKQMERIVDEIISIEESIIASSA